MNYFTKTIMTSGITMLLSLSSMNVLAATPPSDTMSSSSGWQNLYIGNFTSYSSENDNSVGHHCHYSDPKFNLQFNKVDLNDGVGGTFIYMCGGNSTYKWNSKLNQTDARVTDIGFVIRGNKQSYSNIISECTAAYGGGPWFANLRDLNTEAGGDYIYLCYQTQPGKTPITKIKISASNDKTTSLNSCLQGTRKIVKNTKGSTADLNDGAGGKWISVCID
ncbi:hypothetical protein [Pseudoalteromonas denitrificans]|uniref:Uncharacterized protein n=1 Tax=Pseudoalteromonas denitrificans DSM 6059 TaxID=1123010 RepID=A0A1I1V446_9GAMM|nr:hypothetical protein [Pseudoalteromonas denitrificans]SFD76788.1 hypothetical protein SAMN02745724_05400 [Pseudoalteromonas denitrificans DSM 6059]